MNNNAEVGFEEDVDRLVSKYLELLENQDVSLLRTRSAFTVYSSFIKQICLLVFYTDPFPSFDSRTFTDRSREWKAAMRGCVP